MSQKKSWCPKNRQRISNPDGLAFFIQNLEVKPQKTLFLAVLALYQIFGPARLCRGCQLYFSRLHRGVCSPAGRWGWKQKFWLAGPPWVPSGLRKSLDVAVCIKNPTQLKGYATHCVTAKHCRHASRNRHVTAEQVCGGPPSKMDKQVKDLSNCDCEVGCGTEGGRVSPPLQATHAATRERCRVMPIPPVLVASPRGSPERCHWAPSF